MRPSLYTALFPKQKSIIGMIALPPMMGYPEFPGMDAVIERALGDLQTLQQGGVDGVCVENDYDRPHRLTATPEVLASFTVVAQEVTRHSKIPVGVGVLLNDWRASVAIAHSVGAQFVRLDFFVDRVRIAAGVIDPDPAAIISYRKSLHAENIALLTDVQVKYSKLLEQGKTLAASTRQAIDSGSDAVIVSGAVTGEGPLTEHLHEARDAAGSFPVLVGSGTKPENAADLFRYADGAIVGTSLKNSMASHERVVPERVALLMNVVHQLRTGS